MSNDTRQADAPVVVENLSRSFGAKKALDDVSITVPKGCVFGLLGESGAGKTTLIRHLLGLMKPESGSVSVVGHDPVEKPEVVLGRIGYLSEDRDMPGWMRVRELMRYTQGLYADWDQDYADALVKRFDLTPDQKVRTLSRGQLAKTGLLCALAHRPELLILDEPSSGLDVVVRRHILDAVMRSVADEGRTILFSSHLMDEVEEVSDYVAIVHHGSLVLCDKLSVILAAHKKIRVEFSTPQVSTPTVSGALLWQGRGATWSAIVEDGGELLRQQAASGGFQILAEEKPELEDIFVARIADQPLETI